MRKLDLAVHIATKLNRSHLLLAQGNRSSCRASAAPSSTSRRAVRNAVTVEDSMSMVHASRGGLKPASEHLGRSRRSWPAIAKATLAQHARATGPSWSPTTTGSATRSRRCFPSFEDYNRASASPGGFRLHVAAVRARVDARPGKANFLVYPGLEEDPPATGETSCMLTTIRSHDQYNTTIYGLNDRYRGVTGRRDIVFANETRSRRSAG